MGQWTWLHQLFPLADIELISHPLDAKAANVLVRTIRELPYAQGARQFMVRVAPHNVSPFKGGPWLCTFREEELENPGEAVERFRTILCEEVRKAREQS